MMVHASELDLTRHVLILKTSVPRSPALAAHSSYTGQSIAER